MNQFVRPRRLAARAGAPIALAYVGAALLLGAYDDQLGQLVGNEVSPISSASALSLLSAVAAGMMALTAIVFSLVVVAVQHGSTAYSPRLIRVVSPRTVAHALGIFTATFLYALLAIRSVDKASSAGINASNVAIALLWLLASIGMMVRLLPLIRGFTITDVLVDLHRRACAAAVRVYPTQAVMPDARAERAPDVAIEQTVLHEQRPLYLVGLDVDRLVRTAAAADTLIVVPLAIGDSVIVGEPIALLHGGTRTIDERALREAIWLADDRDVDNDPGYAIRLLVDIAIRALSPAVNDPTTAVTVLDEIDGMLRVLGQRDLEANFATDTHGVVRLVRAVSSWDDIVALALTEIHQYGRESIQVERRLAALLRNLPEALPPYRRSAIERFGRWRAQNLATVIDAVRGWIDPLTTDRQGIGHAGHGSH
jgi:uncharacterized membrane protein